MQNDPCAAGLFDKPNTFAYFLSFLKSKAAWLFFFKKNNNTLNIRSIFEWLLNFKKHTIII